MEGISPFAPPAAESRAEEARRFRMLVAFAPLVFILHVIEEAPGFVAWFNAHVSEGISADSFWAVNAAAFVITLLVCALVWFESSPATALIAVGWFGFLMAANAVLHITGAVADRSYVPGVVTAFVLYLPFFAILFRAAQRAGANTLALATVSVMAAIPMLVHGYRIIFLGTRLF